LAIDTIKEIGPGKDFLMHKHTFKWMRGQSKPELIDRKMRGTWEAAGATTAYERAMVKVRYILENHTPDPLSADVLSKIRSIVVEAEKEMGIKS
ncbi:MAG: trimethylamine methyltransferase family protein, partial [Desulfobacula sp.]|nr:trimethylamine methyltransferase family protein [Desulfobacula sp.]